MTGAMNGMVNGTTNGTKKHVKPAKPVKPVEGEAGFDTIEDTIEAFSTCTPLRQVSCYFALLSGQAWPTTSLGYPATSYTTETNRGNLQLYRTWRVHHRA
jgi:hypothetical protein